MVPESSTTEHDQAVLRDRSATVLEYGFRVAVAIMAVGLALALIRREPLSTSLGNPEEIARGVAHGNAASIVGVGILAVILTPFVSTITVAWTFFQQGDRRYAAISATVLLILLVSIGLSAL